MSNQGAYAIIATVRAFDVYYQVELLQARQPVRVYDRLTRFAKMTIGKYISKLIATKGQGQRRRDLWRFG